jgi:hypothetical protein
MYVGSSSTTTTPYVVPAVLLKAIAQLETKGYGGWKQFNADYGQYGYTIIGSDCDIGLMQITKVTADDDALINKCNLASSWYYNLGAGARVLANKWNALALSQGGYPGGPYTVGARNPAVIEDWYYAVWAYNSFGPYYNNPANTALYQPDRPMPPNPAGYENPWHYPYQEMVWGYAIYPPSDGSTPRWDAVQLTLPNRALFTKDQYPPNNLPRPMPAHADPHGATQLPLISVAYPPSQITVQNVSTQTAAVNITTYSNYGTPERYPVRYEDRTLAPLASWTVDDPSLLQYQYSSYTPVSAVVAASQVVAVVVRRGGEYLIPWYYSYTGFGPATLPVPDPGYGRVGSSLWVPAVYKANNNRNSWLYIQNAGFGQANVTVEFYDEGGVRRDTDGPYAISAYGSLAIDQSTDGELGTTFAGSAHIFSTNNQPLAVIARVWLSDVPAEAAFAGFGGNVTLNQDNNYLWYPVRHYQDNGLSSNARVQNLSTGQDIESWSVQYNDCLHRQIATQYLGYLQIGQLFPESFPPWYASWAKPGTYYTGKLVGVAETTNPSGFLFTYETPPTQSATWLSYGPFAKVSRYAADTRVFIQNTNSVYNAKVKLYVLNPDGSLVQTLVDWICPRNLERISLSNMTQVPNQFQGSIKIESLNWGVGTVPGIVTAVELIPYTDTATYTAFNR